MSYLPETTDLTRAKLAAAGLKMTDAFQQGESNIRLSLENIADILPKSDNGSSPDKRKSFVVLLSDGVEGSASTIGMMPSGYGPIWQYDPNFVVSSGALNEPGGHSFQPFQAAYCDGLTKKGHTGLGVEIAFIVPQIYESEKYTMRMNYIEDVAKPQILGAFQGCASEPSMARLANASSEIEPALNTVLDQSLGSSQVHLTQ